MKHHILKGLWQTLGSLASAIVGGIVLSLLLGSQLSAQSKPKAKDFYGDWYLNFKYAEVTAKGTQEEPLFNYSKEICADGGDTKAYSYHEPIRLTLMEDGRAKLYYKEVLEVKNTDRGKVTGHTLSIFRTELPLKWNYSGNRFYFSAIKAKRGSSEQKYELTQTQDDQELVVSDANFLDFGYEGRVNLFEDGLIDHLLGNLNQMTVEHYSPKSFILNGRNTFKELKGYFVEPLGEIGGWHSNIVYVTREKPQEIGKTHYATDAEVNMLVAASKGLASYYMKSISPNSGRNPKSSVMGHSVHENGDGRYVKSTVSLTWEARDFLSGVPYGTCEAVGELTIYPPVRSIDKWKIEFVLQNKNDHAARVSRPDHWTKLQRVSYDYEYNR